MIDGLRAPEWMSLHIGIDLDNTIIDYDAAFAAAARELGIDVAGGKTAVRDRIRRLDGGETMWMRVQAQVYGSGIGAARLFDGFETFVADASARGIPLTIVSHKSEFAAAAPTGPNLRDCATAFVRAHGIAVPLVFEATREAKCRRIAASGVTHFVDDLVEVFADPAFPPQVERWLFAPHGAPDGGPAARVFATWHDVRRAIA